LKRKYKFNPHKEIMKKIEPFYEAVGRRIQSRRAELGISQGNLGRKLNPQMTRASIANIEAGQQRVLAHTLIQLANALEMDLMSLIPPASQVQQIPARTVEEALAKNLRLPQKQIKELTARLTGEASRRKS
jgi:transcriptional regulator with XRE-family HTH domain